MRKNLFIKNGIIMSASALIIRSIAMFFGIYMAERIGSEGIGLYRLIISIYVFFASAVSAGFSLTVTRLATDYFSVGEGSKARFAAQRCMILSFIFGAIFGIDMFLSAGFIGTKFLGDVRCVQPLRILSVSLPFMAVSACVRGYFTARRKTLQSSGEQLLEQIVEIAVFILIVEYFKPESLSSACSAAVIGTTAAEFISFFYAIILYCIDMKRLNVKTKRVNRLYRKILPIAAPVSANSCLRSGLAAIENVLIPFGLKCYGNNSNFALSQYGIISGMTMPVLTFPTVFILPFAMLIIPEIAEANIKQHKNSIQHMTDKLLHFTLLYAIPIMIIFIFFAVPICSALYHNENAGTFLMMLAPVIPFMYLDSVTDGMLKGLNKQTSYLVFNLIDSIIRVILTYILVPIYGIVGVIGVIIVSELLNTTMSLWKLISITKIQIRIFDSMIRPAICIVLPCCVCTLIPGTKTTINFIVRLCLCCIFYLTALKLTTKKPT